MLTLVEYKMGIPFVRYHWAHSKISFCSGWHGWNIRPIEQQAECVQNTRTERKNHIPFLSSSRPGSPYILHYNPSWSVTTQKVKHPLEEQFIRFHPMSHCWEANKETWHQWVNPALEKWWWPTSHWDSSFVSCWGEMCLGGLVTCMLLSSYPPTSSSTSSFLFYIFVSPFA